LENTAPTDPVSIQPESGAVNETKDIDPYYRWLGIPTKEQPPNHYRLLGIQVFEMEPDVIEAAADRQMGHLRTYQAGRHAKLSQRLLNEVAAAKVYLLDSETKRQYDAQLRAQLEATAGPTRRPGPPPRRETVPTAPPAYPSHASAAQDIDVNSGALADALAASEFDKNLADEQPILFENVLTEPDEIPEPPQGNDIRRAPVTETEGLQTWGTNVFGFELSQFMARLRDAFVSWDGVWQSRIQFWVLAGIALVLLLVLLVYSPNPITRSKQPSRSQSHRQTTHQSGDNPEQKLIPYVETAKKPENLEHRADDGRSKMLVAPRDRLNGPLTGGKDPVSRESSSRSPTGVPVFPAKDIRVDLPKEPSDDPGKKPPKDPVEPPATANPFAELPPSVGVTMPAETSGPIVLGKVQPAPETEYTLNLLGADTAAPQGHTFSVAPSGKPQTWYVQSRPADGDAATIAAFIIKDQELSFVWSPGAKDEKAAAYFPNCVLELKLGESSHGIVLRKPKEVFAPKVDFEKLRNDVNEQVAAVPDPALLKVEITSLEGEFPSYRFKPAPTFNADGGTAWILMGETDEVPLAMKIESTTSDSWESSPKWGFVVTTHYKVATSDSMLKYTRSSCQIQAQKALEAKEKASKLEEALAKRKVTDSNRAQIEAARKKIEQDLETADKALDQMVELNALHESVSGAGEFQYRVFLLVDDHEVEVLRTKPSNPEAVKPKEKPKKKPPKKPPRKPPKRPKR